MALLSNLVNVYHAVKWVPAKLDCFKYLDIKGIERPLPNTNQYVEQC